MMAIAVMGLVIDAISKRVAVVFGTLSSMLARPKARSYTMRPVSTTMSAPLNWPYAAARLMKPSIAFAAGLCALAEADARASAVLKKTARKGRRKIISEAPAIQEGSGGT